MSTTYDLTGNEMSITTMKTRKIQSNIIPHNIMREIQQEVLSDLAKVLKNSFGPKGSNTCIKRENALNHYTKDGHSILTAMHYNGIVEESIKSDLESITQHIVKTVGDGTTSAVILSDLMFRALNSDSFTDLDINSADILHGLQDVVDDIKEEILKAGRDCTVDDIYDICMISTNGNVETSTLITNIYKEYGLDVYIDVSPSTGSETYLKEYDGMTLNTGYADSCYVNNPTNNTVVIDNPNIYFFEHPIDTREMASLFDTIINDNIIKPLIQQDVSSLVPTVIVAPKISQDVSSTMDQLANILGQFPANQRPPILIVAGTHQIDELVDIAKLSNAKLIHKYIDHSIYKQDLESGNAPTAENIHNWAGSARQTVSDSARTKFIAPAGIYGEDDEFSQTYKSLLSYLETELERMYKDGDNIREIGAIKRRLNSLKRNMVEIFIGGITMADRDAVRDLVEDAVLNCRAAVETGVCSAANVTTLYSIYNLYMKHIYNEDKSKEYKSIITSLFNAYENLVTTLYKTICADEETEQEMMRIARTEGIAFNIRTGEKDEKVKTSIKGEVMILDTVSKIIGIMVTSNQFMVPSPLHNVYVD